MLAAGVAVLALLGLATRLALPPLLRWTLARQLEAELGLPVALADVDLWLLRGDAALRGLAVGSRPAGAADPAPDLIRLERLFVGLRWLGLARGTIHLEAVELDGLALSLERHADGAIDPLRFAQTAEAGATETAGGEPSDESLTAAQSGAGWPVRVDRASLRDLSVRLSEAAADGGELLRFAMRELAVERVAFEEGRLAVATVAIDAPALDLQERALGAAAGAPGEPPPADAAPPADFSLRVDEIELVSGRVALSGERHPIELSLRASARELSVGGGETFPVSLEIGFGDGSFALEGELDPPALGFRGALRWSDLALPPLLAPFAGELGPWLRSARSAAELDLELALAPPPDADGGLRASGSLALDGVSIADPAGDEGVGLAWERLEIQAREVRLPLAVAGERRLLTVALERVALSGPSARWTLPSPALPGASSAAPAPPSPAPPPAALEVALSVDEFALAEGRVELVDRTRAPPYRGALQGLELRARAVGWPAPRAEDLALRGVAPEAAAFALTGSVAEERTALDLELDRLSLPPLNVFLQPQTGIAIGAGEASLRSRLRGGAAAFELENAVTLHDLSVGSDAEGFFRSQFGVPLQLGVALLRGPGGEIELGVPLRVEASAVRVDLTRTVASALRGAILGALSTPLDLLGAVVLADGRVEQFSPDPVPFAPGVAELGAPGLEMAERLGELLVRRPALAATLRGRTGEADLRALAAHPGEAAPPEVAPERLEALARGRARSLLDWLRAEHGLEAAALRAADETATGAPGVEIELSVRGVSAEPPAAAP